MAGTSSPVTELLIRWSDGDTAAREKLVPLIYEELRRVARQCLVGQRHNHTLQSTALVHEAYLRLVGQLAISPATVKREWATARLWLLREMHSARA